MEVLFSFLDLKITQNKENSSSSLFYYMGWHKTRSNAQAAWPRETATRKNKPQPLHPVINYPKYAILGKLMLFVNSG